MLSDNNDRQYMNSSEFRFGAGDGTAHALCRLWLRIEAFGGIFHQFGKPGAVPSAERHPVRKSLHLRYGVDDVDGDTVSRHGGVIDVQIPVGVRQYGVHPKTSLGDISVILHQACHQQYGGGRGPGLRCAGGWVGYGFGELLPVEAAEELWQPAARELGRLEE